LGVMLRARQLAWAAFQEIPVFLWYFLHEEFKLCVKKE
jgi:hypothetical protein